jgi:hypothetical protein
MLYWQLLLAILMIFPAVLFSAQIAACEPASTNEECRTMGLSVMIKNLKAPGAFEVINTADADVDLAWEVGVEQRVGEQWRSIVVEQFELIEQCGEIKQSPCRKLLAKGVIRPVPWTGYSCSSQCNTACRANVYYGPGQFRFIIRSCSGQEQINGSSFKLPPFSLSQ